MWLNDSNTNGDRHQNANVYQHIPSRESCEIECDTVRPVSKKSRVIYVLSTMFLMLLSAIAGFAAASLMPSLDSHNTTYPFYITKPVGLQSRVGLKTIARTFEHNSDFTLPPPTGPDSGNKSEPIWDSLVPKGLGYISHPDLPSISIPTVFHQLHCLYTVRRAYYANQDLLDSLLQHPSSSRTRPELQRFDLGKNRTYHVGHCFDFLQQGLTCSADSTLEPAIDEEHEFLGSGFLRQCRDFDGLKAFTEKYRAFEYEGFLADGVDIHGGHSHR